jgi:hypothetical protein
MIDLKHMQLGVRISMRKGIQSRAQQNVLRNAIGNSVRKVVLRVAAARNQKGAKPDRERPVRTHGRTSKFFGITRTEDRNRNRILKHKGPRIVELVRSAAQGNAERSSRWTGGLHVLPV